MDVQEIPIKCIWFTHTLGQQPVLAAIHSSCDSDSGHGSVLALARKSPPGLAGTTTKTRRQLDGANEHQPGQFARLCLVNPNSTIGGTDKHLRSSPSKRPPLQALLCSIVHFALWQLKHMVSCRCTQRNISTAVVERPVVWSRSGKGGANALELEQQRKWGR